ncbi:MAG: adenosylhomocysteinase, partial [Clostridia bacterium]|nr:adenosylhomocysteinase [Clostridia bacterium]
MSMIRDIELAPSGENKIEWVRRNCPLLRSLEEDFSAEKPFAGKRIALSIHLEAKTAYLCKVLAAGGAEMFVTGSNPLSTQDDVAAALVKAGLNVYAWHGATPEEYEAHLRETLKCHPHVLIDDGGDLINLIGGDCAEYGDCLLGGCEETTTGILRLKAREREGCLPCPMV